MYTVYILATVALHCSAAESLCDCVTSGPSPCASRLLDCFVVDSPASSVALSPVGEYLVTTHVDEQGIYLW